MAWVAFLGGINVGGHRVTMERLRGELAALGYDDVSTFIASGNVIFGGGGGARAHERAIETHLAGRLGYPVPTFVRRSGTIAGIAALEPFGPVPAGHSLHVVFLRAEPDADAVRATESLSNDQDQFTIRGRELYWQIGGGMSDSSVKPAVLARAHGQAGTARNATSLRRLAAVLADRG